MLLVRLRGARYYISIKARTVPELFCKRFIKILKTYTEFSDKLITSFTLLEASGPLKRKTFEENFNQCGFEKLKNVKWPLNMV